MAARHAGRILFIVIVAALAVATLVADQKSDEPEVLLYAALQKERVEGDLEGAIKLYQAIVPRYGSNRPLTAQALVQMGRCYEKLGKPQARKLYEQVLRDYQDQTGAAAEARARLAGLRSTPESAGAGAMVARRVFTGVPSEGLTDLSSDGRYLTAVDWEASGNLILIDVATGQPRTLTHKQSWFESAEYALFSKFSPGDGQVAYVWMTETGFEIRLVGMDGSQPSVLYRNDELGYISSPEWAPDGKALAAVLQRKDGSNQIALISTTDGSARPLKTLDWRPPLKLSFSPDGRYLAYDFPPKEDAPDRDIFLLATDGSREVPLVQHAANDFLLGWAPEGGRLVFASDRSGTIDAWMLPVADGRPQGSPEILRPDVGRSWPLRFTPSGSYYYGVAVAMDDVYVATLDPAMSRVVVPPAQVAQKFVGANKWPEWSPDGKQLAYVSQLRPGLPEVGSLALTIQSLETGRQRQLFPRLSYFNRLRWSPDGRSILVNGRDHTNRGGIYRIDAETGEATALLRTGSSWWPRQTEWFRDGKAILYMIVDAQPPPIRRRELATGAERAVYSGGDFALSPDGGSLVISEDDRQTKSSVLKLVSLATGESRELARAEGSGAFTRGCAWAPDGGHVLCAKHEASANATSELWRFSIHDQSTKRLLTMKDIWEVRVHPDGRQIAFTAGAGKFNAELWVMENLLPPLTDGGASAARRK